jgi:putative hydrolase of the HAD superfamily
MAVRGVTLRAVLFDALGTLVRLEPPAPRLRSGLRRLTGVDVGEEAAERAFRAEIDYYLAHHLEGRDEASLSELRDRCSAAVRQALARDDLAPEAVREAMLDSLEFTAYPDAAPALAALRELGIRLVVASNWDCSLPAVLERAALGGRVDAVVSSAVAGQAKPAPAVFREALRLAGTEPRATMHVGDSVENDVRGAQGIGLRAVLVVRDGKPPRGVEAIRSLAELPSLVLAR